MAYKHTSEFIKNETTFYCFSPPVMLATFIIESVMAAYTIWRYKLTVTTRLIVASLFMLALFQLSEYYDCTGLGISAETWSRVGYGAITTLPALGLHMMHRLAGKQQRKLVVAGYVTMATYIAFFLLGKTIFRGYECTGNYVIFQLDLRPAWAYGLYYYGWLITAIVLGMRWANAFQAIGEKARIKLLTVRALIIGYLVFLVPTTLANTVRPETRKGIPSIMCGFAVMFAFIMVFFILPKIGRLRHRVPEELPA